jgi:hypothetical protein
MFFMMEDGTMQTKLDRDSLSDRTESYVSALAKRSSIYYESWLSTPREHGSHKAFEKAQAENTKQTSQK